MMIVLGKGGHTEQMIRLVDKLGDKYNYEYIVGESDIVSEKKIKIKGEIFKIQNPREMNDKNIFIVLFKLLRSFIQSIKILIKSKSKFIVTCGPALGVPIAICGKLLGKKVIFIESWSRVYTKSLTGKILYKPSTISFIQWLQQKENYPKSIFAGRLG